MLYAGNSLNGGHIVGWNPETNDFFLADIEKLRSTLTDMTVEERSEYVIKQAVHLDEWRKVTLSVLSSKHLLTIAAQLIPNLRTWNYDRKDSRSAELDEIRRARYNR